MKYYFALTMTLFALAAQAQTSIGRFASGLDSIRRQLKIPAMSVALEKDSALLLKTAFGYAFDMLSGGDKARRLEHLSAILSIIKEIINAIPDRYQTNKKL
jgi:hypothetical protein